MQTCLTLLFFPPKIQYTVSWGGRLWEHFGEQDYKPNTFTFTFTVCTATTCKGKETFTFVVGGSAGQKLTCGGLRLPTFFRQRGGGGGAGGCGYLGSVHSFGRIRYLHW